LPERMKQDAEELREMQREMRQIKQGTEKYKQEIAQGFSNESHKRLVQNISVEVDEDHLTAKLKIENFADVWGELAAMLDLAGDEIGEFDINADGEISIEDGDAQRFLEALDIANNHTMETEEGEIGQVESAAAPTELAPESQLMDKLEQLKLDSDNAEQLVEEMNQVIADSGSAELAYTMEGSEFQFGKSPYKLTVETGENGMAILTMVEVPTELAGDAPAEQVRKDAKDAKGLEKSLQGVFSRGVEGEDKIFLSNAVSAEEAQDGKYKVVVYKDFLERQTEDSGSHQFTFGLAPPRNRSGKEQRAEGSKVHELVDNSSYFRNTDRQTNTVSTDPMTVDELSDFYAKINKELPT